MSPMCNISSTLKVRYPSALSHLHIISVPFAEVDEIGTNLTYYKINHLFCKPQVANCELPELSEVSFVK